MSTIDSTRIILLPRQKYYLEVVGNNSTTIILRILEDGTLSFEGSSGQLFSITDSLSGTIFSVNDISGILSIEVLDDGTIKLAEYNGSLVIGNATEINDSLTINGATEINDNLNVVSPVGENSNGVRQTKISTSQPSGGNDGDIWLVYT